MRRFLITTGYEPSWRSDRPVLFLGEWCRHFDRRSVWEALDYRVAPPYGLAPRQKYRDLAHTEAMTRELIPEVAAALNECHHTSHSPRYWQIVLGHWLRRYVDVVFNRYATLQAMTEAERPAATVVVGRASSQSLAVGDSMSFIMATNDDRWNHDLYGRLLEIVAPPFDIERVTAPPREPSRILRRAPSVGRRAAQWCVSQLSLLARDTDAVIFRSYFPRRTELALQASLAQCPQLWSTPAPPSAGVSHEMRDRFRLAADGKSGLSEIVRRLLPDLLPTCFLEGYRELVDRARGLPWPSRPRFVFTSNSFDTDEVFKAWCAEKVDRGHAYFAGQHGANYGTNFYAGNDQWPDRAATDAFFTWGWSDPGGNTVAAFNFRSVPNAGLPHNPSGGLLLIEECGNHRITPWDGDYEFARYLDEQYRFVEALPVEIQSCLTVRLHQEFRFHRWSEPARWAERLPSIAVDPGLEPMRAAIGRSRLVVYSYESTGVLENLANNVPTLCFWWNGLDHILPSARPYYDRLVEAGVIVTSATDAVATITRRWPRVREWWHSATVQAAVSAYCERFARREPHPVKTMRRLWLQRLAPGTAGRL